MTAVEVCLICDIAECRHIRERKAKMTATDEELNAPSEPVSRAQLAEVQAERDQLQRLADGQEEQLEIQGNMLINLNRRCGEQKARADRAEAALAAQIEADAVAVSDLHPVNLDVPDGDLMPWALTVRKTLLRAERTIRAQPRDRTALDRMLRAEREKALRDAAETFRGWRNDVPMTGEECANAILAMIDRNAASPNINP